mmetsp:Transcript_5630/g.12292  ORF Transcript_5630/g.12292 Transcript_5630/m.12292 type:complete len:207 (+) Transcript_5630:1658-2278(+)
MLCRRRSGRGRGMEGIATLVQGTDVGGGVGRIDAGETRVRKAAAYDCDRCLVRGEERHGAREGGTGVCTRGRWNRGLAGGGRCQCRSLGEGKGHEGGRHSVFLRFFFSAILWECKKCFEREGSGGYSRITKLRTGGRHCRTFPLGNRSGPLESRLRPLPSPSVVATARPTQIRSAHPGHGTSRRAHHTGESGAASHAQHRCSGRVE